MSKMFQNNYYPYLHHLPLFDKGIITQERRNMNDLQIFNNDEFGEIRTITKDNEPMFCLADVCKALEISNPSKVAQRLDDDERTKLELGRAGETNFITESGLYAVILRSDKPSAKKFRKWVTSEVLPSIRKNGGYITGQETLSDDELLSKALLVAHNKIAERDKIIEQKQARIERMKPKAIFADAVATSRTSILIGDLAKLICQNGYQIGQKRLFEWLRNNGYLCKSGSSRNMPMQRYVEQGLFEVKESNVQNPDGSVRITRTTKITGKGQLYFVNKFLGREIENGRND
nr:MAG TPA: KilAC domain protein [Caudoviricetes sp.]